MAEPKKMSFADRMDKQNVAEVASNQENLAYAYRYATKAIQDLEKEIEKAKELQAEILAAGDDEEALLDYEKVKRLHARARALGATI